MEIGKRLKILRTELALKQGEFADKLGISQSALSDFEREFKPMAERYIKLICLTFGVNETWLRTGEGEMVTETPPNLSEQPIYDQNGHRLTPEEVVFMGTYLKLSEPNKNVARTTVNSLLENQEEAAAKKGADEKAG